MRSNSPYITVIISGNDNRTGQDRTQMLLGDVTLSIPTAIVIPSTGSYKGQQERSAIVLVNDWNQVQTLKSLAAEYNQESILIQHTDRTVELQYTDGSNRKVLLPGSLVQIGPNQALQQEAYTYVPSINKYYIVA